MKNLMHVMRGSVRIGVPAAAWTAVMVFMLLASGVVIIGAAGSAADAQALYCAALNGDNDGFEKLVSRMPDLSVRDHCGFTPLLIAASFGRRDAVEMLLSRGAAVDVPHPLLGTPLMLALANGHVEVASVLLKNGADVGVMIEGWDPLACATRADNLQCLELVLAASPKINYHGRRYSLLTLAVNDRDVQVLRRLLSAGVDPNMPDADGATPLFHAVESQATRAVRVLLLAGADPDHIGPNGRTPRDLALASQSAEMLEVLKPATAEAAWPRRQLTIDAESFDRR